MSNLRLENEKEYFPYPQKFWGPFEPRESFVSGRESIRRALCCLWTMQNVLCFVFRINEKLFSLVCIFKIQFARQEIGNISFLFVIVDSCFLFLGLLVYI